MELSRLDDVEALGELADVEIGELRELQLRRLRWSLGHAYDNVAHYRAAFDSAGVHPDDLTSLADLARFPLTSKQDLRQNYPFGMFAVPREQVARVHASSGTTGKPTVVGYTAADIQAWASVMARSIYAAGGRPGDLVHVAYGYGLFTGGLGAHYGAEKLGCTVVPVSGGMTARQAQLITDFEPRIIMVTPSYFLAILDELSRQGVDAADSSLRIGIFGAERLGCTVVPISGGMTARQVQLILDFQPQVIMVTPSYFLSILDELARQGLDAAESSLRIGIFGAEPWTEAMRAEMQQRARLTALDIYGLSEVMGPGIGQEAAGHPGR
ncbi:MAG: phenylacetate-CoA ligase, partial [Pseudonocardiales bacterium]|nr:phenylacetate-CoA ligase [Pseudonocardiales bacterium]